jgi:hypothetical protein
MMTDLVNEHMGDDVAERLVVLGPVIENGAPVEEDHIGQCAGMSELLALREAGALEQAEQIELALCLHIVQHIVFREILYPDDDIAGEIMKILRQACVSIRRECVKILERRRFEAAQLMQRKPVAWQISIPSAVIAFTVV